MNPHPLRLGLLAALCFLALTGVAVAKSPYAGSYYGFSYSGGQIVAGANVTISKNGKITAQGIYVDGERTSLSGQVDATGHFTVQEGRSTYRGAFTANGKSFLAQLTSSVSFRGKRIPDSFPVAGVYAGTLDTGAIGAFLIDKKGRLYGAISDDDGDYSLLSGSASNSDFRGSTEDNATFAGTFSGRDIQGTYVDADGFEGTFSGSKL